ncbi:NPSR1-like protein [Mya arenaria]|uniref:NPSR1-like protein n=1 Tax=Mya arenaria TaxID=6604 RepID=A0ABY7F093_MYAAR|nr:NPSR1-like protein [Mya arenaria]
MNVSNISESNNNYSKVFPTHIGLNYKEKTGARDWFHASLVLAWLFAILTITLNIAVIMCICRQKKMSRLYFLLLNMAVADLLTGMFDTTFNATERSLGYKNMTWAWFAGIYGCKIQRTAANVFSITSNFILAATSFDRAIAIAKPMINFKQGDDELLVCVPIPAPPLRNSDPKANGVLRVFNAGLPRSKKRSLKLMCGIVAGFVAAWTPFFTLVYIDSEHPSVQVGGLLYYLNGIINPVVFFIFHRTKPVSSPPSFYCNGQAMSLNRITKEPFQTLIAKTDVKQNDNSL